MSRDRTPTGSGRAELVAVRQRASSTRTGCQDDRSLQEPGMFGDHARLSRAKVEQVYYLAFCPSISWSPSASSVGFSSGEIGVN